MRGRRDGTGERAAGRGDALLGLAASGLLRALHPTWRYRTAGEEILEAARATGRPVALAVHHGRMLLTAVKLRRFAPAVMVSRSRDGERIARLAEFLGWRTVRGSSSSGGVRAFLELARGLGPGDVYFHPVDGPLGPAGEVKPGLLALARRTGAPIVPLYAAARSRWQARSWDRMQLALPFSRVHVRFGEPLEVPPGAGEDELEALRAELEARLAAGYARIEAEARA